MDLLHVQKEILYRDQTFAGVFLFSLCGFLHTWNSYIKPISNKRSNWSQYIIYILKRMIAFYEQIFIKSIQKVQFFAARTPNVAELTNTKYPWRLCYNLGSDISVWMRNVQLALLSVPLGLLTTFLKVKSRRRREFSQIKLVNLNL